MILVTGGKGYVGSRLVNHLKSINKEVRVLDNNYYDPNDELNIEGVEYINKDIRNVVPSDLKGIDGIIHLAGISNDPTAEYNPDLNFDVNTTATEKLAIYAKEKKIQKFIFASTCSIYDTFDPEKINQQLYDTRFDPLIIDYPKYPYSNSKYQAEIILTSMAEQDVFEPVIFRKGTIFGYSPRMRFDLAINTMLKDCMLKNEIRIDNYGQMWRPFLYINSAVNAYVDVINNYTRHTWRNPLNIVDINISISHLVLIFKKIFKDLNFNYNYINNPRSYLVTPYKEYKVSDISLYDYFYQKIKNMDFDIFQLSERQNLSDPIFYNIKWMKLCDSIIKNNERNRNES